MDALGEGEAMPPELCVRFELPPGSPYGSGTEVLMNALAEQTSLAWPDEFPEKLRQPDTA